MASVCKLVFFMPGTNAQQNFSGMPVYVQVNRTAWMEQLRSYPCAGKPERASLSAVV